MKKKQIFFFKNIKQQTWNKSVGDLNKNNYNKPKTV